MSEQTTPTPTSPPTNERAATAAASDPAVGTSRWAIASVVMGVLAIAGYFSTGVVSVVCGPLGIVFAAKARGEVRRGAATPHRSLPLATLGLICSSFGFCLGIAVLLLTLMFVGPPV
mgnify:CR=1 FL=1